MPLTGKVPGREASKNETNEFGGAMNWASDPEKSFVLDWIWAWISSPTVLTQSSAGLLFVEKREKKWYCWEVGEYYIQGGP